MTGYLVYQIKDGYRKLNMVTAQAVKYTTRRPKMKFFSKITKNEEGATAIEYGLIAALIAVAAIVAMGSLGTNLSNTFNKVSNSVATT